MSTHAQEYYENNASAMKPVRSAMPDLIKGFGGLHQAAMKAGTLTVLEKELIALAIGLAMRCENCIYAHVQAAMNAGASREQILEAGAVAVLMQGGPTYTYLPRLLESIEAVLERSPTSA
jgi:AhpD family alkylhydroperoxidase